MTATTIYNIYMTIRSATCFMHHINYYITCKLFKRILDNDVHLKRCVYIYSIKMTTVDNNKGIIVYDKNTIISKTKEITVSGKWNICLTKILVHKLIYLVIPIISINIIMKQQSYNMRYMRWCHSYKDRST